MHHERFLVVAVAAVREAIHQGRTQLLLLLASGGIITWLKSTDWTDVMTKAVAIATTGVFLGFALLGKFDELRIARRKKLDDANAVRRKEMEEANKKSLSEKVRQLEHGQAAIRKEAEAARITAEQLRRDLNEKHDDVLEYSQRLHESDAALHRANTVNAEQTEEVRRLRTEVESLRTELARLRGSTQAQTEATTKLTKAVEAKTSGTSGEMPVIAETPKP
jgi:hypothetical protein